MAAGAPPNPYQTLGSMPGPMPPKKKDNTEEIMKGCHGVFKALSKMEEMNPGLKKNFDKAKDAIKDAVANVLKGDPSTLDAEPPPPASNDSTPPPPEPPPANPAADASAPPA